MGFLAIYKGKNRELGRENTLIGTVWVTFTEHTQRCSKRKGDGYLLFTKMALREVETGRNLNITQREMGPGRHMPNQRDVEPEIHRDTQKEHKTWAAYEHPSGT